MENGIKHGIDYVMKIVSNVDKYETRPNLCASLWHEDEADYDTDIQSNTDSINFDEYEKYYLRVREKGSEIALAEFLI